MRPANQSRRSFIKGIIASGAGEGQGGNGQLISHKWTARDFAAAGEGQLPTGAPLIERTYVDIDAALASAALVNVAAALQLNGATVSDIRIACGGVQCVPRRLHVVEDIVPGSTRDAETIALAAGAASRGATTLNYNHFKVPLLENLVRRVIRDS